MKPWTELPFHPEKAAAVQVAFNSVWSDKCGTHEYERIYQHFLPETPQALLEIGLAADKPERNSLRAWKILYPNAKIFGADKEPDRMITGEAGITTFLVDQSSEASLKKLRVKLSGRQFDFIIDDASHLVDCTARTFEILSPLVKPGGLYFIEDIHTSHNLQWAEQTVTAIEAYFRDKAQLFRSNNKLDSVIAVIKL